MKSFYFFFIFFTHSMFWRILIYTLLFLWALSGIIELIRMQFHKIEKIIPDTIDPHAPGIQYVGHGTSLIQINGIRILTDPVLPNSISGFLKRFRTAGIDKSLLSTIDVVLISHKHADHFNLRSIKKMKREILILAPPKIATALRKKGFVNSIDFTVGMNYKQFGITFHAVPSQHPTSPDAIGFIIEGKYIIYFPGDTALSEQIMKEIGNRFRIDIALLPIGCYRGRVFGLFPVSYSNWHMGPKDLPLAQQYLNAKLIIPIHWGTFIIGSEPIEEAMTLLKMVMKNEGRDLPIKILEHGRWMPFENNLEQS